MFKAFARQRCRRVVGTWVAPRLLSLKGQESLRLRLTRSLLAAWLLVKFWIQVSFKEGGFLGRSGSQKRMLRHKADGVHRSSFFGRRSHILISWESSSQDLDSSLHEAFDGSRSGLCRTMCLPRSSAWIRRTNGGVCILRSCWQC